MEIVDPHHHLWDTTGGRYPWLAEPDHDRGWGDWSALRRSYLVEDLRADAAAAGLTLRATVHVQANYDPSDPVGETRWLDATAEASGLPAGIVAFADLSSPDVARVFEAHAASPRLRGIRQVLNRHPDPRLNRAPRDWLADPAWRRGVGRLAEFGLSFDAQVYHHQMEDLFALAVAHPDTTFILDHAGMPAERDDDSLAGWRRGIARLAEAPNVRVKIGGFGMVDLTWTVDSIRPFVLHCIDRFGPERSMFASNFPVDRLMASYGRVWSAFAEITADFAEDERRALFVETAMRVYRL